MSFYTGEINVYLLKIYKTIFTDILITENIISLLFFIYLHFKLHLQIITMSIIMWIINILQIDRMFSKFDCLIFT